MKFKYDTDIFGDEELRSGYEERGTIDLPFIKEKIGYIHILVDIEARFLIWNYNMIWRWAWKIT